MKQLLAYVLIVVVLIALPIGVFACPKADDTAEFYITDWDYVEIRLYPDVAPRTVSYFKDLVRSGYYEGQKISRIEKGWFAEFGEGTPGAGDVTGEFAANGIENGLSHTKGVVSLSRGKKNDAPTGQFFICLSSDHAETLDGSFAAFGKVIYGYEFLESIENLACVTVNGESVPIEELVIEEATLTGGQFFTAGTCICLGISAVSLAAAVILLCQYRKETKGTAAAEKTKKRDA